MCFNAVDFTGARVGQGEDVLNWTLKKMNAQITDARQSLGSGLLPKFQSLPKVAS